MTKLGAEIRRAREDAGIGLRALARAVGLSPTYLSRLENGLVSGAKEGNLRLLAEKLSLHPDAFVVLASKVPADVLPLTTGEVDSLRQVRKRRKQVEQDT